MQKYKLIEWLEDYASNHQVTDLIKLHNTKTEVFTYSENLFLCCFYNNDIKVFDTSAVLSSFNNNSWLEKSFTIIGNNLPCLFIYKKEFYLNQVYQDIDYSEILKRQDFRSHLQKYQPPNSLSEQLMNYLLL